MPHPVRSCLPAPILRGKWLKERRCLCVFNGHDAILYIMNIEEVYRRVLKADVSDVSPVTPLQHAPQLSDRLNNAIYMKREDMTPVFSFKCRGAHNKIRQLSKTQQANGVIAASAGNHAQGVALSANILGIQSTIVMPKTTPSIKVDAVKRLGATIILHGDSYDEANRHAIALAEHQNQVFIHPYDDPDVIAGQGTLAKEMIEQHPAPIDYIFVSVGGGGLLAGVVSVFRTLSPTTRIIAVEPNDSDCLRQALLKNERVVLPTVGLFADGVAVKQIGDIPFQIIQGNIDGIVGVSSDDICVAIKDIYNETRTIVEPAGALSLAGLTTFLRQNPVKNKHMITIHCGANMNFDRLRYIAERTEIGNGNEQLLSVTIPEENGALMAFCRTIGARTITQFNYRYQSSDTATIFVGLGRADDDADAIKTLTDQGYAVDDLSDNECATLHIRYMIGGASSTDRLNERIFRFEFPERPGALYDFLTLLNNEWAITLFHYRNHGAAYGHVLAGFHVPEGTHDLLKERLIQTGIPHIDETNNKALRAFSIKP